MYVLILIIAMGSPYASSPVSVHSNTVQFESEEACLKALENVKRSIPDKKVIIVGAEPTPTENILVFGSCNRMDAN